MALAAEEIPFVLQGPRPPVPPAFWESYWGLAVFGAALAVAAVLLARRFRRRGPAVVAPFAALETGLRLAEGQPAPAAIAQATRALRAYLAAVDARAAASLSTEELLAVLAGLPVFLPARQPLAAALRGADAAKFAGGSLEPALLVAGIREAARRVEDARRTFARPPTAPLLPPRPPAPAGPPPLPRRDLA
jgi:hypothetical protein